jgi:hypothetical protein
VTGLKNHPLAGPSGPVSLLKAAGVTAAELKR